MKRFLPLLLVGALGLLQAQTKKWTIAVYLCADNDLETYGITDFNEMEYAIDTTKYNVYVLMDRISGYDGSNGNWTGTRLYKIRRDTDLSNINSTLLKDCGELNMGNPANLIWFMDTVRLLSSTECYWLILWNHGDGWRPIHNGRDVCFDDTNGDEISVSGGELNYACEEIFKKLGKNLSIISYDACLMGMLEVEYETKDYADVTVHSQETEPADGYPYDDIFSWLNSNQNATPQQLARQAAYLYVQSYSSSVTHSAVDMGPWYTRYYLAVDKFARELIKAGGKSNSTIATALSGTQSFTYASYKDLYHFAQRITAQGSLPASLRNAAQRVIDLQGSGVIGDTTLLGNFQKSYSNAHGITIYGPTSSPSGGYSNLYWVPNSAWYWFINGSSSLPNQPRVTYYYNSLGDSIDYGNGIQFRIDLINVGGGTAGNVSATLSTLDPYVTVVNSSSSYGNISPEATATSLSSYVVNVSPTVPRGHRITFFLSITGTSYTNTTSFNIIATGAPNVGQRESCWVPPFEITLAPVSNPVRGETRIAFYTTGRSIATLKAYDISGREIAKLYSGTEAGDHEITWSAPGSGTYFLRLSEGESARTIRVIFTE
ncbi:MAG: clostripain-related cysteine peptidase [candidate division WOR-3 bacterium]